MPIWKKEGIMKIGTDSAGLRSSPAHATATHTMDTASPSDHSSIHCPPNLGQKC